MAGRSRCASPVASISGSGWYATGMLGRSSDTVRITSTRKFELDLIGVGCMHMGACRPGSGALEVDSRTGSNGEALIRAATTMIRRESRPNEFLHSSP